jgi:HPt (histidine-containing phosphotransfer) domain-containing protein
MANELDLSRLAGLAKLLDSEQPQIVETLVDELTRALGAIDTALADADLSAAALAAHAARNSALMIDARPLLACLDALESSARRADPDGAREAQRRLEATWPPLRAQLHRAAAQQP